MEGRSSRQWWQEMREAAMVCLRVDEGVESGDDDGFVGVDDGVEAG
jgi:hypothetical protein